MAISTEMKCRVHDLRNFSKCECVVPFAVISRVHVISPPSVPAKCFSAYQRGRCLSPEGWNGWIGCSGARRLSHLCDRRIARVDDEAFVLPSTHESLRRLPRLDANRLVGP
eukprot:4960793-Prymnesium_polylepis.1